MPNNYNPLNISFEGNDHLAGQHHILILLQGGLYSVIKAGVTDTWAVKPREQIRDEAQKQRNILKYKLGQVHISKSPHQNNILGVKIEESKRREFFFFFDGTSSLEDDAERSIPH